MVWEREERRVGFCLISKDRARREDAMSLYAVGRAGDLLQTRHGFCGSARRARPVMTKCCCPILVAPLIRPPTRAWNHELSESSDHEQDAATGQLHHLTALGEGGLTADRAPKNPPRKSRTAPMSHRPISNGTICLQHELQLRLDGDSRVRAAKPAKPQGEACRIGVDGPHWYAFLTLFHFSGQRPPELRRPGRLHAAGMAS